MNIGGGQYKVIILKDPNQPQFDQQYSGQGRVETNLTQIPLNEDQEFEFEQAAVDAFGEY